VRPEGLGKLKESIDIIRVRLREFPACSIGITTSCQPYGLTADNGTCRVSRRGYGKQGGSHDAQIRNHWSMFVLNRLLFFRDDLSV
jgi:hypothetical protein